MKKRKEMLFAKGWMPTRVLFVLLLSAAGIGQGIAQGGSYADSPFGIHDPKVPDRKVPGGLPVGFDYPSDVYNIGARWARYAGAEGLVWDAVSREDKYKYDWSRTDYMFNEAFKSGLNLVVVINSANSIDQFGVVKPLGEALAGAKIPKDMNAYLKFLKSAVERYNGDGIDDAPNSPVVKYWEVENEVDSPPFWGDTPEKYALLLKESYKTIKSADPNAKVLIAGVTGSGYVGFNRYYVPILEELERIKDTPSDKYFDIFSFHYYEPNEDNLKNHIQAMRDKLNEYGYRHIPFWFTETGVPSGMPVNEKGIPPPKEIPESSQAKALIQFYIVAMANKVSKAFWVTLTEWSGYGGVKNGLWDNVGLINNPANDGQSHKKLSYYTYKKMTETLEGSDWNNIQTIQEKDGVYIYKFTKAGKPIWVAWNDNSVTRTITISGISSNRVKATEAVPKYESGKEVADYTTAFRTDTLAVTDGAVTLTLGERPVFVEPLTTTSVEGEGESIPHEFRLYQNYPNPFNPTTTIRFSLPQRSHVTLKVFDVLGREVATLVDGELNPGEHSVVFDVNNLPSGVYFYKLTAGNYTETKKMILLK